MSVDGFEFELIYSRPLESYEEERHVGAILYSEIANVSFWSPDVAANIVYTARMLRADGMRTVEATMTAYTLYVCHGATIH